MNAVPVTSKCCWADSPPPAQVGDVTRLKQMLASNRPPITVAERVALAPAPPPRARLLVNSVSLKTSVLAANSPPPWQPPLVHRFAWKVPPVTVTRPLAHNPPP